MNDGRKKLIKTSVRQSIARLISEAESAWKSNKPQRSERYAKMVMGLVRKNKVRLTKEQKNKFCRKCFNWWVPGDTLTLIYDQKHHLIRVKCGRCGYTRRI